MAAEKKSGWIRIHRQSSYAPKSVFYEQSKPVYVWPKLHGGQSANICTVHSLKNSIKNKEEFNLERRSSHPNSKTSFTLGKYCFKNQNEFLMF